MIQISCGANHTGALIEEGYTISFGNNSHGQTDSFETNFAIDDIIAKQISCGENHTAVL